MANRSMKLAFVTSLVPTAKPDTGFEIANAAIVAALREAGHHVVVFGFLRRGDAAPSDPDTRVISEIIIENAAAPKLMLFGWLARALVKGLPLAVAKLIPHVGGLAEKIRAEGPFDAVVLNSVMMPGACPELLDLGPCLLIEHNVEHLSAEENAAHAGNGLMRWLYAREARTLRGIEQKTAAAARFVWFLAEEDKARLGVDLGTRCATLPLVSTTSLSAPAVRTSEGGYDVGLIGTWSWAPNRAGLDWFLKEVVPRLPGDITVAIAGRLPDGVTSPRRSVTMMGRVADAGGFLASCRTLALASRAGTGVQLKTIEAFQLGKPAVATPLSLRGFTERPANVRVADDGPSFASALTALVQDVRAGRVGVLDGAAFVERQRQVMAKVLTEGLASLSTEAPTPPDASTS